MLNRVFLQQRLFVALRCCCAWLRIASWLFSARSRRLNSKVTRLRLTRELEYTRLVPGLSAASPLLHREWALSASLPRCSKCAADGLKASENRPVSSVSGPFALSADLC